MLLGLIRAYRQLISPLKARSCRFYPTCSAYACEAVETLGTLKALPRVFWRVLRCNPFSRGGFDPVIRKNGDKDE